MLEQEGGAVELIQWGQHRTFAQALRDSVASTPAQVEVPVWLRKWEKGEASGKVSTASALTYPEPRLARCSPVISDHLQGPFACELGCGR